MKLFKVLILAVVLLALADSALATPDGEYIFTADGGFRFSSINAAGPLMLEALADAGATIYLVSSIDGSGADPNTAKRKWPSGDFGLTYFSLRANIPRPFVTSGTSTDSCYVDLVTATEVIITWTND